MYIAVEKFIHKNVRQRPFAHGQVYKKGKDFSLRSMKE